MPRRNKNASRNRFKSGHRAGRDQDKRLSRQAQEALDIKEGRDPKAALNTKDKAPNKAKETLSSQRVALRPNSPLQLNRGGGGQGGAPRLSREELLAKFRPQKIQSGAVVEGRVDLHPDGFGFLIPKGGGTNIYLPEDGLKYVMNRDELQVRVENESSTRLRGTVVQILKRGQKEILGLYRPYKGGAIVVPYDAKDRKHSFRVAGLKLATEPPAGAAVLCTIVQYPDKGQGSVEIHNMLEDPAQASNDTLKILLSTGWPREFSRAAISEAEFRALRWREGLSSQRRDIRHLPLVTIDGRDARDFDDAVCARTEPNKMIRLWVAIADVSYFVKPGSALDIEAYERSTSVYFPDHVVPMLPEVLSNGVCSLNPFEDRACLVCEMLLLPTGKIHSFEMYEGLMQSKRRLTYEQMQAFIDGDTWAETELKSSSPGLEDSLSALLESYHRLAKARKLRGSVDLDLPEAQVLLNRDGTVYDIQTRTRLDAHRLIEECMLAANECTAKFIYENCHDGLYRIHEEPDPKKINELANFLLLCGIDLSQGRPRPKSGPKGKGENKDFSDVLSTPQDYARLTERLRTEFEADDPTAKAIQSLILRSLKQARYSTMRVGHFALATLDYTHFTSPIRRYPDLIVHRLIKDALRIEALSPASEDLEQQGIHCSDQERRAMDMERKLIDTKKCRYMEPHLGEVFDAWVTGVTEKGMFCQIESHFVDGLLSADTIHQRIKHRFDPDHLCYAGPGKSRVMIGTKLRILVAAVDIQTRRIDFDLVELLSSTTGH